MRISKTKTIKRLKKGKLLRPLGYRRVTMLIVSLLSIVAVTGFFAFRYFGASAVSSVRVCDKFFANYVCMSMAPGVSIQDGRYIYGVTNSQSWRWNVVHVNTCGGYVTTTCPFTVGDGLNDKYVGHAIYKFYLKDNTNYCASENNDYMYLRNCNTSDNQTWVGVYHGSRGTWTFVNVQSSNSHSSSGNPNGFVMTDCSQCHMYMSLDNNADENSNWTF
jgi:hypothetical protein